MEKLEIIRKMLSLVNILPEERLMLVKELISEWGLTQDECFPKLLKKRGRKPKIKDGVVSSVVEQPKRRGRKPKLKDDSALSEETTVAIPQSAELPKRRRGRPRKNAIVGENSDKTSNGVMVEPKTVFASFADYPVLKKQVIGQEQDFLLLYKWEDRSLLSSYILTEMMPIGIYIPYKAVMFGKYKGFVVYLYDEVVCQSINDAIRDAKTKDEIDGEYWSVMSSLQLVTIKPVMERLNRILKKVGGDEFRGNYASITPGATNAMQRSFSKIRYTINVK